MARYFASNTIAGFIRNSVSIVENQTAGNFNSTYVDRAIAIPASISGTLISAPFVTTATGDFWFRLDCRFSGTITNGVTGIISGWSGTTNTWRFDYNSGNNRFQIFAWNGTAMVGVTLDAFLHTELATFVFHYDTVNKAFRMYRNGILVGEVTGLGSGMITTTTSFRLGTSNVIAYYSQIMAADYDLRASNYSLLTLTGNSSVNTGQSSGSYTDVNELSRDDTTVVQITTSGNRAGFTKSNFSVPSGKQIGAFVCNAIARAAGTITNGKIGLRSAGSNYSSANLGYDAGFNSRQVIFETDPATTSSFTATSLNAIEVYVEAS